MNRYRENKGLADIKIVKIRKEKDKPNKSENSWISLVFCWNFYQQLIGKDYYYYSLVEDKFIIVMSI